MKDPVSSRFAILLDGALEKTERLEAQIEGRRVIAADGGIRHAETLGVTPELWLGDFDSTDGALADNNAGVPRLDYPRDKAISDGEIAIRHALAEGATDLLLCGALGGERSDHLFLNLSAAMRIAREDGIAVRLTSGTEEAFPVLPGRPLRPDWPQGTVFSLIGFTDVDGLTIRNAKWPLESVQVPFGSTLTLSNIAGEGLRILIVRGCVIAIGQLV
jgi:thiamine pyrophosphokinase